MKDKKLFCKAHISEKRLISRNYITSLSLILFLFSLLFAAPVKGQNGPLFSEETQSIFCPHPTDGSAWFGARAYLAGYMTTDYLSGNPGREPGGADGVRAIVSFAGTDKSVIQSDNCLAAGIAAQGPDTREGGIFGLARVDWGYTLLLVLYGAEDDPCIEGAVWEIWEWGRNGLFPIEPPAADLISSWRWSYPGVLTIDSEVTLAMEWDSTHLNYFATIENVKYDIYSYTPAETEKNYFMLGTCDVDPRAIVPGTVKWFQFPGAWSIYSIGNIGWTSHIKYPSFRKMGEPVWRQVEFAYSVHGMVANLDHTYVWGGGGYPYVSAHYYCEPWPLPWGEVNFYPTSDGSTIPINTLLWGPSSGGGGGGCPYVYVWDGQRYVMDNNLLPASETSNGSDVPDYYRLEQSLIPTRQGTFCLVYSLQIREFEHEHDYFDQVELLAVDHNSDVNVAVTPYGEILTYSNSVPPISAIDSDGIDMLSLLSSVDENYYQGYNGSYVILTFAPADVSDGVKLVIRSDKPPVLKSPVYVQTLNTTGDWDTVAVFHTRTYWATDIINMTNYLPDPEGDLKIRLLFVSTDKIDYVGLDTTPQADIQVHQAYLLLAFHSTQGNVKPLLATDDQTYAELLPDEQIQLAFILPNSQNQQRTFILHTEGHYTTIL
jgi:hypothetical protein